MRVLQFFNTTQNVLRISVSCIGQRRLQFSMRKILNFKQIVRQTTNFRTYTSKVKNYYDEINSLSISKDSFTNENDAVISTFDLFSIGIGPSSRFVTVTP